MPGIDVTTLPDDGVALLQLDDLRADATQTRSLPLGIQPQRSATAGQLAAWLTTHRSWVQAALHRHGALFFRGFQPADADAFEQVARAIAPGLQSEYLGTSPRVNLTPYVFTASELPEFYPIPQHAEMSFLAEPPRHLFFWAKRANDGGGGETPLCDLRAVWRDLDPAVRGRFAERGLTIVRNYAGRAGGDRWQLKPWPEIFGTTDRQQVEATCAREGFVATWGSDERLTLTSRQPAMRPHPDTGEQAWLNHSQVFHLVAAAEELRRIARWRPSPRALATWLYAETMAWRRGNPDLAHTDAPMHCTWGDGSPIARADLAHVLDVIWRHLVVIPWQTGDMVAVDNRIVSHGRLPYRGPRVIAVAFA